jgi:hypothetical protein
MLRIIVALHTLGATTLARARTRHADLVAAREGDRGSVTLEQVIIALGLFLLAVAVIAGITAAVNSRLSRIN